MNWVDDLKIAIIEKNTQKAYELITNIPSYAFKNLEDLLIAQELISQTIEMLESDKENIQKQMLQIKMAKKFLE